MTVFKKTDRSFHTLLIFPPIWTPVTPYLALPILVAYLRERGFLVKQLDSSLDFFVRYLLTPPKISELYETVQSGIGTGDFDTVSRDNQNLIQELRQKESIWIDKISMITDSLTVLRDKTLFYDPQTCIRAQNEIYDLLKLASLAFFPTSFTFNTFSNNTITNFPAMVRFCDDIQKNPFLAFYESYLAEKIEHEQPSLVGISISTSHQMAGALTLARFIKKRFSPIHVTLGGRHVLRLSQSFLKSPTFLPEFCHSMVLDNGEKPLEILIRQLAGDRSLESVPNLIYYNKAGLISNGVGKHEPIETLPTPDFSDLMLENYLAPTPILPMRLSEGCYWGKCSFCSRYDNKKFQTIPPQTAVNQMGELHRRYGASCFTINDDCLTPTYLEALSRGIIDQKGRYDISLWCKPVGTFTRERLRLLSSAGVRLIRWGVESGHPRILKLMNKGTTLPDTVRVLKDASETGIWNHATMILGFPTETEDEAKQSLYFLNQQQEMIHSSILFRFVLLNHSYIIKHPDQFGIQSVSNEESTFSYENRYRCSKGMGGETLSSFINWAQKYRTEEMYGYPFWFYLRIREYLLLYAGKRGLRTVKSWKVRPDELSVYTLGEEIEYYFEKPHAVSEKTLEKIIQLIQSGEEVGISWLKDNLKNAFSIGYAVENSRIVGTMTHKRPLTKYVREIEKKTGLNLQGYIERGYSSVRPEYRSPSLRVGDQLLKGLVQRSPGQNIYVTIRMDNRPAIQLTLRNHMRLGATFFNERTGHEIGVFVNRT